MQSETLEKAISLNLEGYNLTFYEPGRKGSNFKWGKWKTQRQTISDLIAIIGHYPTYTNIGAICGEVSRLIVLDFDSEQEFYQFQAQSPNLCQTYTMKTSRGFHLWFRSNAFLPMTHPLCEVWYNSDHYASCEGNIHPSGHVYSCTNDTKPKTVTVSDLLSAGCKLTLPEREKSPSPFLSFPAQTTGGIPVLGYGIYNAVKSRLPIAEYLNLGPTVKRGKRWYTVCPCHNDANPSLEVNYHTQRVSCYNPSCKLHSKHGLSVIDAYAILNGVTPNRAVYELAQYLGIYG